MVLFTIKKELLEVNIFHEISLPFVAGCFLVLKSNDATHRNNPNYCTNYKKQRSTRTTNKFPVACPQKHLTSKNVRTHKDLTRKLQLI